MRAPTLSRERATIYLGDVLEVLREMDAESVHTCVTSPPYWGLRNYGCDGQIGLEATPEAFVAKMVDVFREVRRVMRQDATLWLNLGDSYSQGGGAQVLQTKNASHGLEGMRARTPGMASKQLLGIPWRVALALQADGWWLRSDIIWAKPNPMPESVTDRPTKSYEHLFLLSKAERYYYDADAVREPDTGQQHERNVLSGAPSLEPSGGLRNPHGGLWGTPEKNGAGRNLRDVWTIATQPTPEAHFATFPEDLVMPCIKAGTSERGVCPVCGAPWRRVVELGRVTSTGGGNGREASGMCLVGNRGDSNVGKFEAHEHISTGWQPTCTHDAEPTPATVLDPFVGSGTTLLVAQRLGRCGVGIELNPAYIEIAAHRLRQGVLL